MGIEYITRTLSMIVLPKDANIFDERATTITVIDEGAGQFLEVSQSGRSVENKIWIETDEWPELRRAIDEMFGVIK